MTPLVFASLGFSWLWVASAGDPCSSMETEGQSGCVDGQGIGAALIQTKLHGLKQVVADEVHGSSKQTTLGHALQLVTQLVQKSGGHSWNMTADEKLAVETIRDMVQDLFNGSLIQHGEDQFEVDQARDRIQSCTDDTRNELNGAVTGKKNQANATRTEHAECRKRENKIIANTTRECDSYHSYRKSQSNFEPFNYATCMSSDLTFNHIKSDHEVTKQNMESCLVKTVEMLRPLYHEFLGCKESNELRKKVHLECDEDQEEFEADFCRYSRELDGACSTYSGCRSQAIGDRSRTHEAVKKAEVARKADWVTAEHILCLLQVFEQDNSDKAAQLKECTEATVNTTRINIEYHSIPEPDPCPGPWRTDKPCDDDWLETEYRSQSWFNSSTINQCIACQAPAPPTPAPSASAGLVFSYLDVVTGPIDSCLKQDEGRAADLPFGFQPHYTVEVDVKVPSDFISGTIVLWGNENGESSIPGRTGIKDGRMIGIQLANSKIYVLSWANDLWTDNTIRDDQWHHLAFTYNRTHRCIHVDYVTAICDDGCGDDVPPNNCDERQLEIITKDNFCVGGKENSDGTFSSAPWPADASFKNLKIYNVSRTVDEMNT